MPTPLTTACRPAWTRSSPTTLPLQLAYTFSKSIDNRSTFSVDGTSGANPFNYLAGERGLSDFDQRHILAINGIWDLPFLKSNGWLTTAFGGWELCRYHALRQWISVQRSFCSGLRTSGLRAW